MESKIELSLIKVFLHVARDFYGVYCLYMSFKGKIGAKSANQGVLIYNGGGFEWKMLILQIVTKI